MDDLKVEMRSLLLIIFHADTLDLWNVSIPDDKISIPDDKVSIPDNEVLITTHLCDLQPQQVSLQGVRILDKVSPSTLKWQAEHIHIIILPHSAG